MNFWKEIFIKNIKASIFGLFLLFIIIISKQIHFNYISRYDFIFLSAVIFQLFLLLTKKETKKEFFVIIIFHILATLMELFKTSKNIGSWNYPEIKNSYFIFLTVPLFAGFFYSAVGSYISRLFKIFKLSFLNFPKYFHLWILSILIYLNFFTHHYIFDLRYVLFLYSIILFWKTKIIFEIQGKKYSTNFLIPFFSITIFIWIAENISTFNKIWLYPNQIQKWEWVSFHKIGSWYLLLILSFTLISLIYKKRK